MNPEPAFEFSSILRTKLYPPPITADLVSRIALLERLGGAPQRPVTLISAPPGYGKSILASMWLQESGLPGGWVSLDESDNDLHTFASYFVAAIQEALPQVSLQTSALLSSVALPLPVNLARYLLADLDELRTPFFLVLDDIHVIHDQAIFTFLEALLDYPSPVLHLVLVGRQDPPLPIATWRAYDRVTEIRMRDLRFTVPETALFLSTMLQHDISDPAAAAWTDKTEGWIVALRLAALSLRYFPEREIHLPEDNQFLQEYLLTEVLAMLPPRLKSCLLKTALFDRFCAPLCEAICSELQGDDNSDKNGERFITWLRESNLFVINLDQQGEWFRFHHLFQADLQRLMEQQSSREEITELHLKASRWFADNGWVSEAIRHALEAKNNAAALQEFANSRNAAMNGERWQQLEQWVRLFPEEVVENEPLLLLTRAHLPLAYGFDYDLEDLLTRAGALLPDMPADSAAVQQLWAEVAYFTGLSALMMGPPAIATDAGTKMRATLPPSAYYLHGQALALEAFGQQMSGSVEQGGQIFQQALGAGGFPPNIQIRAYINLNLLHFMEADLSAAHVFAEKSIALAQRHDLDASEARCFAGTICYLQNDLAAAEAYLLPVTTDSVRVDPVILAHSACTLMRVYTALEMPEKAAEIMQQTRAHLEETANPFSQQLFDMFQVELALDQGDVAHARQMSLPLAISIELPIWFWHYFIPQLTPVKVWVAVGEELDRAAAVLEEMDIFLQGLNRHIHRIDILALLALIRKAQNNWPAALERVTQSVTLAARGNLIRNYLNFGPQMRRLLAELYQQKELKNGLDWRYVERILDAFSRQDSEDGQHASPVSLSFDPLTEREQEVLRFLATDLSTREIAAEMAITWSTLRSHIKNIYSKMGVHGRYEAVLQATEHDLL